MARWRDMIDNANAGIYRVYRRCFGTYIIDDPRPTAKEAPYTFFLPSQIELDNVAVGDDVKLIFRGHPKSRKYGAERMWVQVTSISQTMLEGTLTNQPSDLPQIRPGDRVQFQHLHIAATDKVVAGTPDVREYWDRCLVDKCVTDDRVPVHYLYREEPDMMQEGDKYPDSGWRIRGDYRGLTDAQIGARETEYVALGLVLNADDSWLHLIDEPVGARFIRDFKTGNFAPENR
jgi:hypothetical protein